ncbi:MAG TPA: trigger factor, partial [Candidatus Limnocylindrales bacterium]|nr:trigger factor [Candidatus Limnocylindrales bacterium]
YFPAMSNTVTPAPRSSLKLRFELPPEQLSTAIDEAVRHISRRTRIAGFRPGKAPRPIVERAVGLPAIVDEAMDHLVQRAYRDALIEHDITPLTNADVEIEQAEEGKPVVFSATVQVRPEVKLGDYRGFNFKPEIESIDDPKVDKVVEELADQHATLAPVEDRGAKAGDYAVIGYVGTRDGVPFDGGSSDRMPLILGQERLIPGFEDHVMGLGPGEKTEFDITFPDDYGEASLAGKVAHFALELKELREKVLPTVDDEFARSIGTFADLATLRTEIRARLERNALDKARHEFSDRIIEYAVANADLELPDILIDQEVEVIHDEFRASLARQGIAEEAYLKVVEKTEADLHAEFRPNAEKRVKVLLVLSKIAEAEGVEIPDADVEAEVAKARERYGNERKTVAYFESARGRGFIRSTLRRSRVVEQLVEAWLAAHPDHPPIPHLEDDAPSGVSSASAEASAAIDATDPGEVLETDASAAAAR